jgi:hypothetical protein
MENFCYNKIPSEDRKSINVISVGLIIVVLFISSIVLLPSSTLHATSKGLKLYLTVDTDLLGQDIRIDTEQHGRWVYGHDGFVNTGLNEYTLEYPRDLIENGEFQICVTTQNDDWYNCGEGYNSREKKPERVFVNLITGQTTSPDTQSQTESQSQSQSQTVIVCPANARCVIEQ